MGVDMEGCIISSIAFMHRERAWSELCTEHGIACHRAPQLHALCTLHFARLSSLEL